MLSYEKNVFLSGGHVAGDGRVTGGGGEGADARLFMNLTGGTTVDRYSITIIVTIMPQIIEPIHMLSQEKQLMPNGLIFPPVMFQHPT